MNHFSLVMFGFSAVCVLIVLFFNMKRTNVGLGLFATIIQFASVVVVVPVFLYLILVISGRLGLTKSHARPIG